MYDNGPKRRALGGWAILAAVVTLLAPAHAAHSGELDLKKMFQEGIPASPFAAVVYGYANAMLEHGRDTYGPQKTGLLLSALDRKTLAPLETRPPAPAGVSQRQRPGPREQPLVGANPQMDQNLLRLLYFLKGLSGEDRYPQAADAELKWFLEHAPSAETGLLPWGEHLCWNVMTDEVACGAEEPLHEFSRPWMLWERCFALAPQQSRRFARGLWDHHVADHQTGALRCAASLGGDRLQTTTDCPRQAGFFIRTWAETYAQTSEAVRKVSPLPLGEGQGVRVWRNYANGKDSFPSAGPHPNPLPEGEGTVALHFTDGLSDDVFLKAIDVVLARHERAWTEQTQPPGHDPASPRTSHTALCGALSMAIDCDGAAPKVPHPLRRRLATFAAREDRYFCSLPHDLKTTRGFAIGPDPTAGPRAVSYTPLWDPRHGGPTTAAVAVMCASRYENTGKLPYRELIVAAADAYLDSLPGEQIDAWPLSFGQAITLELAAFRITARRKYHARAFTLGEIAIEKFFDDGPLPRASLKSDHYENTTGADTLVLALAELHLSTMTITAVRTPANTIDR